jgi:hypothetical protein
MLEYLFGDVMYYLALAALAGGVVLYTLSYLVGFLPMLKPHALLAKVAGIVLVITGGYYVADHRGYERRVAEDKAEIERLNGEARAKEVELGQKLARATSQLRQAKDDIRSKQTFINARIDSGELRLPTSCGVQADSSSTSGTSAAGTESERQAIKDIVQIAADGDSAIVSLNSCIAQYETVMKTVNEGVK